MTWMNTLTDSFEICENESTCVSRGPTPVDHRLWGGAHSLQLWIGPGWVKGLGEKSSKRLSRGLRLRGIGVGAPKGSIMMASSVGSVWTACELCGCGWDASQFLEGYNQQNRPVYSHRVLCPICVQSFSDWEHRREPYLETRLPNWMKKDLGV